MKRNSIVIDLDHTICFPNDSASDTYTKYFLAKPNIEVISKLKSLIDYDIIIHSARRMVTHNGNIDIIEKDVREITEKWLELHSVPYTKLVFGKPYSSTYYVDDKAMTLDSFLKLDL